MISSVAEVLGAGAALAAVAGATYAFFRSVPTAWNRTIGRRRSQRRLLEQLAVGSSPEFVSSLLGVPQFRIGSGDDRTEYHRLNGVWVLATYVAGSVGLIAITITAKKYWVSTVKLSLGSIDVTLGKTLMQDVPLESEREECWVGTNRVGHIQEYSFGRPGGYQTYWLAYNAAGCGVFDVDGSGVNRVIRSTVNTLIFAGAAAPKLQVFETQMLGVKPDVVRFV